MSKFTLRAALGVILLPILGGVIAVQLTNHLNASASSVAQSAKQVVSTPPAKIDISDRVLPLLQRRREHDILWYGVQMLQFPEDLVLYQGILHSIKPDIVIETGTFNGGLSLYLASLMQTINPDGKIITVDLDPTGWNKTLATFDLPGKSGLLERIVFLEGSSTDPKIVAQISEQAAGKRVLVILDSLHTREHVLDELNAYAPLVSQGSYLIVNDTQLDGKKTRFRELCGVTQAIQEWLPVRDDFVTDTSWNRFLASCCHFGVLKRTR